MTDRDRYAIIKEMRSVGGSTAHTFGKYPTFREFKKARRENRIAGTYGVRLVILANNPNNAYTFHNQQ